MAKLNQEILLQNERSNGVSEEANRLQAEANTLMRELISALNRRTAP